jgi:uncharacterized protein YegP (UPF0339 family)
VVPAKFVVRHERGRGYDWDLHASNGRIIATSHHYMTHRGCRHGIESVRLNAPGAKLEDPPGHVVESIDDGVESPSTVQLDDSAARAEMEEPEYGGTYRELATGRLGFADQVGGTVVTIEFIEPPYDTADVKAEDFLVLFVEADPV